TRRPGGAGPGPRPAPGRPPGPIDPSPPNPSRQGPARWHRKCPALITVAARSIRPSCRTAPPRPPRPKKSPPTGGRQGLARDDGQVANEPLRPRRSDGAFVILAGAPLRLDTGEASPPPAHPRRQPPPPGLVRAPAPT